MKKIQGSTIIELIDPTTCAVIERHEDSNMVTNIFKLQTEKYYKDCLYNSVDGVSSISWPIMPPNDMSNGLLLFEDELNTDPNDFVPFSSIIGKAGSAYSGSNNIIGTLNTTESDLTSNNLRKYVWDFATDRANGTIRSLGLTAKTFIDAGNSWQSIQASSARGALPGTIYLDDGRCLILESNKIKLYTAGAAAFITGLTLSSSVFSDLTAYTDFSRRMQVDHAQNYIYLVATLISSGIKKLLKVSLSDGSVSGSWSLSHTPYNDCWHFFSSTGKFIAQKSWVNNVSVTFWLYDTATSSYEADLVTDIKLQTTAPSGYGAQILMGNYRDKALLFTSQVTSNSTICGCATIDDNLVGRTLVNSGSGSSINSTAAGYGMGTSMQMFSHGMGSPSSWDNWGGTARTVGRINFGLFTKNNLAAPVVKTSANTMKVTYQLTWG